MSGWIRAWPGPLRWAAPALFAGLALGALAVADDAPGAGPPLLWTLGDPPRAYLLGTIHLAQPELLREDGPVMRSLASSDALATEIPLDPVTQARALAASMLPEGESLTAQLPDELVTRLSRVLEARGLPLAAFERLRPWAMAAQLALLDELPELTRTPPLDLALYRAAAGRRMRRVGLETLAEQIGAFERLGPALCRQMLREAVEELERAAKRGKRSTAALREAYAAGDLDRLGRLLDEQAPQDTEFGRRFRRVLIDERNRRMARRIGEELSGHPDEVIFIAVGALHLGGPQGLLHLLAQQGLGPRRLAGVPAGDRLPVTEPRAPKELSP